MHRDSKITCIMKSIAPIETVFWKYECEHNLRKQCINIILLSDLSKGLKEENDG